ncbi:MAG: aminoacyl-tRNA hydrolase [Christensenellales bacterium]|jgi:PTH1 family peptidyl-tRNA hydrolase
MAFWNRRKTGGYLIVGLGNIGDKYKDSRHNVGFMAVDKLAGDEGASFSLMKRCRAYVAKCRIAGQPVMLAKPTTYMNLSGSAVAALLTYYKMDESQLLVIYDDVDLPEGALRIRPGGGPGTHNGMKSIVIQLGTGDFARVRVGIGMPKGGDLADYVLRRAPGAVREACLVAAQAARTFVADGCEAAMRQYNHNAKA